MNKARLKIPSWYYEVVAPGFKYNMTDIAAAIGVNQLRKVYAFQRKRAEKKSIKRIGRKNSRIGKYAG